MNESLVVKGIMDNEPDGRTKVKRDENR
jgi:hypothetical protein